MAREIIVNDKKYPSLKKVREHGSRILNQNEIGPILNEEDHKFLKAVSADYVKEKFSGENVSISRYEIRLNQMPGCSTRSFWAILTDGRGTDFSFYKALRNRSDTPDESFAAACRSAVMLQLKEAKMRAFNRYSGLDGRVACEKTGQRLLIEQMHLDHVAPRYFNEIVISFRASKGWIDQFPKEILSPHGPGQTLTTFADPALANDFSLHHKALARLRLVSKKTNLSDAHKARAPKIKRPVTL